MLITCLTTANDPYSRFNKVFKELTLNKSKQEEEEEEARSKKTKNRQNDFQILLIYL